MNTYWVVDGFRVKPCYSSYEAAIAKAKDLTVQFPERTYAVYQALAVVKSEPPPPVVRTTILV